jgi:hypothetical protein
MEVSDQLHALAASSPRKEPPAPFEWVGCKASVDVFGAEESLLALPGIKLETIQHIA